MPPISENYRAEKLGRLALLTCSVLASCSARDALVGAVPAQDAGPPTLSSEFAGDDGQWEVLTRIAGASVDFGSASSGARDGRVAVLRLPGLAASSSGDEAGPDLATQIGSVQFLRHGTLRGRLRFPTCSPGEEVAAAMFWYYEDGTDRNGNGLVDTPELDLHVLCGTPSFVILTAWSDFQRASDGTESFVRATRAVDLATGDYYDPVSDHERAYVWAGNDPTLQRPSFSPGDGFHEVGIDWRADRVRFFIVLEGVEVTLWTLTDAPFIPQVPMQFLFNLWHPATHWPPPAAAAQYPAADTLMLIDWYGYWAP